MAARHVTSGRRIVAGQRKLVEQRLAEGKDVREAEQLLSQYERTQAIFEDDLKQLTSKQ
jgi:hypothetical protein